MKAQLFSELQGVIDELNDLIMDLAMTEQQELEAKLRGWAESPDDRLEARRYHSDFNAMPASLDRIRLRGEIRVLEEKRDMLRLRITHIGGI